MKDLDVGVVGTKISVIQPDSKIKRLLWLDPNI